MGKHNGDGNEARSRSDVVYQALRCAIIEQALLPGVKLPEDAIGEQFAVSRTIVRSAFARLYSEGLIEMQPNRGASVAKPSLEEARDIFELRRTLECDVVRKLVDQSSQRTLDRLNAHLESEDGVNGRDHAAAIRLAGEFHIVLAECTGNRVLARYVGELVSRCSLILALYGRPHSSDCAVDEHREIIMALRAGNAEHAVSLMDRHLGAVEERAQLTNEIRPPDIRAILKNYSGPRAAPLPGA